MAVNKKQFTESEHLNIQAWELPELDGPKVHEEDALGNRRKREERRQADRRGGAPTVAEAAEPLAQEEEYVLPSAAELKAIREAAREEGYADGLSAGHEEGFKTGHAEGVTAGQESGFEAGREEGLSAAEQAIKDTKSAAETSIAAQLAQAIAACNAQEAGLENELAPVVRDLVLRLTQGLVVQSLQQSPEQIEDIVHRAIQLMPSAHERMQILLHPEDCSMLKGLGLHWLRQVDLQSDDSLSPGGCVVKTKHSLLDYTLDQRYQKQIQALLELPLEDSDGAELRALKRERFEELVSMSESVQHTSPFASDTNTSEAELPGNAETSAEGYSSNGDQQTDNQDETLSVENPENLGDDEEDAATNGNKASDTDASADSDSQAVDDDDPAQ